MTHHTMPRLALALLGRFVPDSDALAGDLIEEFQRGESRTWLWLQVAAAIATSLLKKSHAIRPLRLVEVQPADAQERSTRLHRDRSVNLSASPLPGVGGLGLVSLAMFVTCAVPHAWWVFFASALAGVSLGVVMIAMRPPSRGPRLTIRPEAAAR